MDRGVKTILWSIVSIFIFIGVVKFIWWLTPVILTIVVISFFIKKGKQIVNRNDKSNRSDSSFHSTVNNSYSDNKSKEDYSGEVIDVDFKDVEK